MRKSKTWNMEKQRIIIKGLGQKFEVYDTLPYGLTDSFVSARGRYDKSLTFCIPHGEMGEYIGQLFMDGADKICIYHVDVFGVKQALAVKYDESGNYHSATNMRLCVRPVFHIGRILSWIPRTAVRIICSPLRRVS